MTDGKKIGTVVVATSLLVGLLGGLWIQFRDAIVVIEATVTAGHDDRFHFYSDHGSGWVSDEWSRPLKAGVSTKLYLKFPKSGIVRFKFEPLRLPGEIRFDNLRFTDRIDRPLRPFPLEKIVPKKDITLTGEPEKLPLIFKVPEGAKDPQIYVTKAKEWEFSTRRDLWDMRLLGNTLRITLVALLLILPIAVAASRPSPIRP